MRGTRRDAQILERVRIIEAARRCGVAAAAREHACSRTTVYTLVARFEREAQTLAASSADGKSPLVFPGVSDGAPDPIFDGRSKYFILSILFIGVHSRSRPVPHVGPRGSGPRA